MLNLDTHILLHAWQGDLTEREESLLRENEWTIASIVLWEISKLAQLGRIGLSLDDPAIRVMLGGIHIWPLSVDTAKQSCRLDFRADPADELIAATSIVQDVPLLTRDKNIRKSRIVPLA